MNLLINACILFMDVGRLGTKEPLQIGQSVECCGLDIKLYEADWQLAAN
jgi:hypothetical protein